MLDVHQYVNENNCMLSVSAAYNLLSGNLTPYPYIVKGQYFDVSLNGKSNDKHHLTMDEFVELLKNPAKYPAARVRCKANRSGSNPNGRRKMTELNWEPLRQRLIEEGFIAQIGDSVPMSERVSTPAIDKPAKSTDEDYVVDLSRSDDRKRALLERATRSGQQAFRRTLIECSGGSAVCAVSGCRLNEAIQAAHIMPFLGEADNHPANGILLRADLHLLFDRGQLGIDPNTLEVHFLSRAAADPEYAKYDRMVLSAGHALSQPALKERWRWFSDRSLS